MVIRGRVRSHYTLSIEWLREIPGWIMSISGLLSRNDEPLQLITGLRHLKSRTWLPDSDSQSSTRVTGRGFSRCSAPAESSPSAPHAEDWFLTSGSAWTCPCSPRTRRLSSGRRSGRQTRRSGLDSYKLSFMKLKSKLFIFAGSPWMSIMQGMAVGQTRQPTGVTFLTLQGSHSHLKRN